MTAMHDEGARRRCKPLDVDQVQLLIDLYRDGASVRAAASKVGCVYSCAHGHLKRAGVLRGKKRAVRRLRLVHEREQRPRTRGECQAGPRPCPWASCRYHLAVDVLRSGNVVQHELAEGAPSCALDVAEQGGTTLDGLGQLFGLTRERIRQIEARALRRLAAELGPDALPLMLPTYPEGFDWPAGIGEPAE